MKCHSSNTASLISHPFRKVAPFLCSALLGLLTACGGSSTPVTPTPTPGTTSVQVNVGDGPADWMLAFSMNVSSMSLTGSSGSVNVASTSTPVEMIHRLGIMEPIAVVSAPQGTYTGASITIASCNVTYLDPITKTLQQQTIAGPITAAIPFTSSVTVGTTPLAFNFDLDLENSVTMDNTGKLHLSPTFHFATGAQGQGNANSAFNGGMQQMMGDINSTSTNSFTMTSLQATNTFTIMTNTATQFQGNINNMNMMAKGMGVLVTAALQADGTLLATRVRSKMNSGGIMGGGIITAVTGQPATQLTIVMPNGAGAGNTVSGMSGNTAGTITASSLRLQEQGFRGTTDVAITPGASGTFTLTLMPGCAFTTLTGANKILVYQQTGTNVENNTAIPVGATLRVHGLLFQNAGQWTLIASTIAS
jgi:hypothetical protein